MTPTQIDALLMRNRAAALSAAVQVYKEDTPGVLMIAAIFEAYIAGGYEDGITVYQATFPQGTVEEKQDGPEQT